MWNAAGAHSISLGEGDILKLECSDGTETCDFMKNHKIVHLKKGHYGV